MRGAWEQRWRGRVAVTLGLALLFVLLAHPLASAGSDVWGNVGPASPLGSDGLYGRYPLSHYALDPHFDFISTSLTGGIDASGVPPMIAYVLASVLWALTSFLASALISLFAFAFSLDLLNGSGATGGAGALAPVSEAIHSIYSNVFGGPWLVLAVSVVGIWAMWKALVQRRYAETAGALGLSLIYVLVALFFVAQPGKTIGAASQWTNQMSVAFLSIAGHGSASGGGQAREEGAEQLFDLLVFNPWVVLEFGGLEHCVLAGTGSEDSDPDSVAVRPLSQSPASDAALARRLASGTEVIAGRKTCINNASKYASHFLRFGLATEERDAEYDALNHGDSSKLPDADGQRRGYRLADKPATDTMEEGGQYQRLLLAIVVFFGELGAFCLLGALSVGVILAQVLLLLLLAFSPVALVAAAIPGRGHAFFKGWLEKLVGYLLRKVAYSLALAVVLAVNGALASVTSALGWFMSFGLQALFFWAVFLQRKALAEGLVGIVTGPGAPGRDASLRLLSLYAGGRMAGRLSRPIRRGGGSAAGVAARLAGAGSGSRRRAASRPVGGLAGGPPRFGVSESRSIGEGQPLVADRDRPGKPAPSSRRPDAGASQDSGSSKPAAGAQRSAAEEAVPPVDSDETRPPVSRETGKRPKHGKTQAEGVPPGGAEGSRRAKKEAEKEPAEPRRAQPAAEEVRQKDPAEKESDLGDELQADRERSEKKGTER